ncbi:MAG: hypothetical protein JSV77_05705 [Dehalococcoidales bacterium]|nr:MAG: hypothetical protein JSV77_05705 [Dehalococcoidales bacterium]
MKEVNQKRLGNLHFSVRLIIGILVFGSIWGFLEATLGGFLHMVVFPNKGAIMSGIGVAIMASALAIYRKPVMLPGIGIVAASFKLLDVWLFSLPIGSIHIINPAMAIVFESLAFGLVAIIITNRIARNAFIGIGAGALVGIISAIAWVYFAIYVMNAPAYARVVFTAGEFITNQGVLQAAFSAIFLPLGYLASEKLAARTPPLLSRRPVYFAVSASAVMFCWGISALAIAAEL